MAEQARLNSDGEAHPVIADVVNTPLDVLLLLDDSVLDHVLERLLPKTDVVGENYAAHSTSTS